MVFGWDDANNLVSHCDATGTVTYTYDQRNLVVGLAAPGGTCAGTPTACTTFAYDDNGRRTSTTFPTTTPVTQSVTFDPAGNVTGIAASTATGTLTDFDYAYTHTTSDIARRQSVTDNVTGVTTSYTYDTAGRLTAAAESGSGSASWSYGYDPTGNRTTATVAGVTVTYGYNDADQLTSASNQTATPPMTAPGTQDDGPGRDDRHVQPCRSDCQPRHGSISAD